MATPKGWAQQEKDGSQVAEFVTVEPVRDKQFGLSVLAHTYGFEVGTDASEANSTTTVINATAHAALRGDVIRFTAGALINREFRVYEVATNTITVAETMPVAPGTDAFQILRSKTPVVNADGTISVSVAASDVSFQLDGGSQTVTEDTGTPANNRPLPVKLMDMTGDITVTANNLNVQLTHAGANPDSVQIGDGTETANVNASNELQVADDTARTSLGTVAGAVSGTEMQVDVVASLPAGTNNIGDVDIASALPAGTNNIGDVDIASALPAGTNNIGDVDIASAIPAGANSIGTVGLDAGTNNIGDVDVLTLPSLPAGTNNIGDVDVLSLPALPAGTNNIGDVDIASALPAGTNNIGDIDVVSAVAATGRSSIEIIRHDYAGGSVTTAAYTQLVASTSGDIDEFYIGDTSGEIMILATGAAASEVDVLYIEPGGPGRVNLRVPSGTRLSVKALSATASVGDLVINGLS